MPLFSPEVMREASKGIELQSNIPKPKHDNWSIPFAMAGQGSDLGTTLYAMNKGAEESNSFLPKSKLGVSLFKGSAMAGEAYAIHKLQENHPTLAKGLGLAVGVAGIIPALINYNRLRSIK